MKPIRKTIDLRADQFARLTQIAERCNARASTGPTAGKPSWRALLRDIAAGRVACRDRLKGGKP